MDDIIKKGEKINDYYDRLNTSGYILKEEYQGVTLDIIERVLNRLGCVTNEYLKYTVWCLINNEFPSLFSAIKKTATIADGASTAHIGGFIGILVNKSKQLDREGRDYWIKPLIEIGAVEEVTLVSKKFLIGHLKAKSPNSSYRLNMNFINLLQMYTGSDFEKELNIWIKNTNERLEILQSQAQENKNKQGMAPHEELISLSINAYAKHFLGNYVPVFQDFSDGNRITENEKTLLISYGINFGHLEDVWPDIILYNEEENLLWFIEAVTSDGEVDSHKINGFQRICQNSNKGFGGATTTYLTWKECASRQKKEKNLAIKSYLWINEDPTKHFLIK